MFELFTDAARKVVVSAQEEARMLNHNYIGTEHLLLGIVREKESDAARLLKDVWLVTLDDVRACVEKVVGRSQENPGNGYIPFDSQVKKALENAWKQSQNLGTDTATTTHILFGVLELGNNLDDIDTAAVHVLRVLKVNPDVLQQRLRSEVEAVQT